MKIKVTCTQDKNHNEFCEETVIVRILDRHGNTLRSKGQGSTQEYTCNICYVPADYEEN